MDFLITLCKIVILLTERINITASVASTATEQMLRLG